MCRALLKTFRTKSVSIKHTIISMRPSAAAFLRRAAKSGKSSGILPEPRPVFRHNPIRPKTAHEKAEEAKVEQGFAPGVPLPKRKGFTFHRKPVEKPIVPVEERIARIGAKAPQNVDTSKLTPDEAWMVQRDEIRRQHLRDAYLAEAQRLERISELEAKTAFAQNTTKQSNKSPVAEDANLSTLPTLDSYLEGPLMRPRTEEEEVLVAQQRMLNRKTAELETMEARATELLELYHAASKFITTEEELEAAIHEAFEVNVGRFESSERLVEDKLFGLHNSYASAKTAERLVRDAALGEIRGQPGLDAVKGALSGETEEIKRQAQRKLNQ